MRKKLLFRAALGLGLGFAVGGTAAAQTKYYYPPKAPCQPPPVIVPYCPPAPAPEAKPAEPPKDGQKPEQAPAPTPAPDQAQSPMSTDAGFGAAGAEAGTGSTMLGRADQSNRFNLFDNMSAIPRSRVWFTYMRASDYNTGVDFNTSDPTFQQFIRSTDFSGTSLSSLATLFNQRTGLTGDIVGRSSQSMFRAGFEYALSDRVSIAAQEQYIVSDDLSDAQDFIGAPQFLIKFLLSRNESCNGGRTALAATLGISPEIGVDRGEFLDPATRIYPGLLFYGEQGNLIVQAGLQFGIPWGGNDVYTVDHAVSVGYWLYRADNGHGDCYGGYGCHGGCGRKSWLVGIIPQVEVYGKHVIGDATITDYAGTDAINFGSGSTLIVFNPFVYEEPRHVIDITVGASFLITINYGF
jgi:hypothetical protein